MDESRPAAPYSEGMPLGVTDLQAIIAVTDSPTMHHLTLQKI